MHRDVNVSLGLYRPDLLLAEQLHARKLIHDLLLLKGLVATTTSSQRQGC
jgi:hypothetical protein